MIKEPLYRFFYQQFKMKKSNRIISIIFILLCIYAFIETTRFPNVSTVDFGPAFMPRIAAGLLAVLSIMLFISTFTKKYAETIISCLLCDSICPCGQLAGDFDYCTNIFIYLYFDLRKHQNI